MRVMGADAAVENDGAFGSTDMAAGGERARANTTPPGEVSSSLRSHYTPLPPRHRVLHAYVCVLCVCAYMAVVRYASLYTQLVIKWPVVVAGLSVPGLSAPVQAAARPMPAASPMPFSPVQMTILSATRCAPTARSLASRRQSARQVSGADRQDKTQMHRIPS